MHNALKYASLFVGEGATMASECAILGTPAIYVNSLKVRVALFSIIELQISVIRRTKKNHQKIIIHELKINVKRL